MEEFKLTNKQLKSVVKQVKQFLKQEAIDNENKLKQKEKDKEKKETEKLVEMYHKYKKDKPDEFYNQLLYEMLDREYNTYEYGKTDIVKFDDFDDCITNFTSLLNMCYLIDNDNYIKVLNVKMNLKFN